MESFSAEPLASTLVESLRDIGYTLDTALADLVDNSITAGASTVDVLMDASPNGVQVGVLDNGCGMTRAQLELAMRPGSRNPLESRAAADLGRFGLGLKTASFSQCRKLTVLSRKDGESNAAIWDLDHIAETNRWEVLVPKTFDAIPWADRISSNGTLVVWENPDRIVDHELTAESIAEVTRKFDDARSHLELVFHRFLSGEPGLMKVSIRLNGRPLEAWDPFWAEHPATERNPLQPEVIRINNRDVTVQGFTLPHHRKADRAEWERHAGKGGYIRNQGFYLYRERRLILHGTWFNLARKSELTKLCRVRIDMPNGLDADWKIDVKKASAQPPRQIRQRLKALIDTIGDSSRRIYTQRGQRLVSDSALPVWHRSAGEGGIRYSINPDHPVISSLCRNLDEDDRSSLLRVLNLVGSTIPYDSIFADLGRDPKSLTSAIDQPDLEDIVSKSCRHLISSGFPFEDIPAVLKAAEPFKSNWDRAEPLIIHMLEQDSST